MSELTFFVFRFWVYFWQILCGKLYQKLQSLFVFTFRERMYRLKGFFPAEYGIEVGSMFDFSSQPKVCSQT